MTDRLGYRETLAVSFVQALFSSSLRLAALRKSAANLVVAPLLVSLFSVVGLRHDLDLLQTFTNLCLLFVGYIRMWRSLIRLRAAHL